ncbi:uncharacterized protein BYT42DRAFT_615814 [Radiomyces spectabilis]|uniref:uncharacterized protein n=1 Tax=Radiomyces spectabilis TaxID=64574 RepID=UPI0022205AA8|nr:uncharacterized protein BYT42DRAFT_615814 [Radiomyces spectabilis]KAI8374682.1 hypothetical protein BYT42DRAFT_615814 [Radiomyces spectabilis]
MNILPHKSWHVYNRKNIEKVRKDEAKAKQEEDAKRDRVIKAESEARLELLRHRATGRQSSDDAALVPASSTAGFRLFDDLETNAENEERKAEEKAKDEKWNRQITMYLDKDVKDTDTPWYAGRPKEDEKYIDKHVRRYVRHENNPKKRRREPVKISEDPLATVRHHLAKKDKHSHKEYKEKDKKKKKSEDKSSSPSSSSSSIEALRAQRLERERKERARARSMVFGITEPEPKPESAGRYSSQYNPSETADARRHKRRR